jgi:hypothetical protein
MPNKLGTMFRSTGKFAVRPFLRAIGRVVGGELDKRQGRLDSQLLLLSKRLDSLDANRRVSQHVLLQQYQLLRKLNLPLPNIQDTGFRVYSQSDEDGLVLFVFSLIGMTNRICVDIASGIPEGANSTNLIRNWGFTGFLIEGNEDKLREAAYFFSGPDTNQYPPRFKQAMVNAENVNDLLDLLKVSGEIDLLSLDIDGIDYWVWKSLHIINPRVVICEFTSAWGSEKSVTIPYNPNFTRPHPNYWGASLAAFVKLGQQKGYRLVGWSRYGFNAIFIRKDLGEDVLPEVSPQECLQDPLVQRWKEQRFADFPDTTKYPWVEV